jgi:uncharacterized protein (TIGR01244 family)
MVRKLTETYYVSPQITPEAMAQLAEQGFSDVICNRPDIENGPELQHDLMQKAAEAAGLIYHFHPLVSQTLMLTDNVARQKELASSAKGTVLAYCASGTRCTYVWALGQVGEMPANDIIDTAAQAGYDLNPLRPMLV